MKFIDGEIVSLPDDPTQPYVVIESSVSGDKIFLKGSTGIERVVESNVPLKIDPSTFGPMHQAQLNDAEKQRTLPLLEKFVSAERFTPEQETEGQRRAEIIQEMEAGLSREAGREKMGLRPTAFKDVLKRYAEDPRWQSVVPRKPGKKFGTPTHDSALDSIFMRAYEQAYNNDGAYEAAVYTRFLTLCHNDGVEPFSRSTGHRLFLSIDPRERDLKKFGPDYVSKKYGAFPSSYMPEAPLRRTQIDSSPVDCIVIDSETGKELGRPFLTAMRDDYSGGHLACTISFVPPNSATIAATMYQAFLPKKKLLADYGLKNSHWIMYGKFVEVLMDGGPEHDNKAVKSTCHKFGIKASFRNRPQQGGGVENEIKLLNKNFIQRLEGSTGSAPRHDKYFNPGKKAVYTLERLTQLVFLEIIALNDTKSDVDGLSPNMRWERYFSSQEAGMRLPPLMLDAESFLINMLPGGRVFVLPAGIKYKGVMYDHGPCRSLINRKVKVSVRRNPLDLHHLYVRHKDEWHVVLAQKRSRVPRTQMEQQARKRSGGKAGEKTAAGHAASNEQQELMAVGKAEGKVLRKAQESVKQAERSGSLPTYDKPSGKKAQRAPETNRFADVTIFVPEDDSDE
ncbi:hypothetical protein PPUN15366_19600 [Pseudomonas putida]|uniref:hypothetical protein n=1 Tax=Pseudomonas putida TaxID=303 RepID=UPI00235DAB4A|nr:hypothetical protein [Pseudomonas putida]GLO40316.1 hypothetical protein PPUN15366_19600 [Pseudomonas putida]HDS0977665.1 hypothetical protein [Pseudomonas putida]